jgi:hypothetical protein
MRSVPAIVFSNYHARIITLNIRNVNTKNRCDYPFREDVKSIVSGVPNRVFLGRSRIQQKGPKKSTVKCQPTVENPDRPLCTIPHLIGQLQPEYP